MDTEKINLFDYDHAALTDWLHELGEKPFRAAQLLKWIYHHGVTEFTDMTNLSQSLRARLAAQAKIEPLKIIKQKRSGDGTCKWLLQVDAQNAIETVFIPEETRGTLCVSSQVGCPLDCKFCATAQQGFSRNLDTREIIGQVWLANRELGYFQHHCRRITNITFMGMGEPLLNYDKVLKSIRLLTEDCAFGLSKRKVTVSTTGIVPGIDKLSTDSGVSLALSLHAVDDVLRSQLIPVNRRYNIEKVLAACKRYAMANGPVTIEYVMLKDINDKPLHARKLVKLLHNIPAKINLIPFNQFPGSCYLCSDTEAINTFRTLLMNAGFIATTRKTRGDDIDAACGQLAGSIQPLKHSRKQAARQDENRL